MYKIYKKGNMYCAKKHNLYLDLLTGTEILWRIDSKHIFDCFGTLEQVKEKLDVLDSLKQKEIQEQKFLELAEHEI